MTFGDLCYAKESDVKKVSSLQKIKDFSHALLRALKLVSHVKKLKNTEGTLFKTCVLCECRFMFFN